MRYGDPIQSNIENNLRIINQATPRLTMQNAKKFEVKKPLIHLISHEIRRPWITSSRDTINHRMFLASSCDIH